MTLQLTDAQLDAVRELRDKRAAITKLQRDVDALRDELLLELRAADTDKALTASGAAAMHVQTQLRRGVNAAKLEALYPEVYEKVFEEKPSYILKIDLDD